ncbi:transglutaminase domain-containing protein [Oxynema aestuarii]|uniref:transglutaminase domain-containing protein n=1 Tax=Oxynema aestuarii TaxID=2874213 RepID=UPI0035C8A6C6
MLPPQTRADLRTVRPFGVYRLHGLTFLGDRAIAVDSVRGHLLEIDLTTENTTILNPYQVSDFLDVRGLAFWQESLWLTREDTVYCCPDARDRLGREPLKFEEFARLGDRLSGVAVWESAVYVSCQRAGYIYILNRNSGEIITQFYAPGIGEENLAVSEEDLWICDSEEQTIYCMDRATGDLRYNLLTPYSHPTAIAFDPRQVSAHRLLHVAYAEEEIYIRDDPNASNPHQVSFRDRTFIHPVCFQYHPQQHYTLSNGYLVEMSYVEELSPLEPVQFEKLDWRIALPADTARQRLKEVRAIGMPFEEETERGQRFAVFKFDTLQQDEARIFGWKALVELYSIKYHLTPRDVEDLPELPEEFKQLYLVDNDQLAMNSDIVRQAAREAIGNETNLLRKILSIRDYVYDKLDYGIKPYIDPPDVVLERGVGSCGEYVGVLLALLRLNGIACRTVGRYKCPPHPERKGVPLQPDYNHVWLEFYVPGIGWIPMESNPDDNEEGGLHPMRFFMGLAWHHIELGKGIRFESLRLDGVPIHKSKIPLGDLALNHVRFTILDELPPPNPEE